MHVNERERLILDLVAERKFISFRDLEIHINGSPATIRRDLRRMAATGRLVRVRGGIKTAGDDAQSQEATAQGAEIHRLQGTPFEVNAKMCPAEKAAIGKAAANLCLSGEGIMIDGGTTTLQMCPHLNGLKLQVLTNSLHIALSLIRQTGTHVVVPAGTVFPEQDIILSSFGDDGMPRFHAPKLFMGAAGIGRSGLLQADPVLVAAERRLIARADEIIVLVDSSKFLGASGHVVCELSDIDTIVTDPGLSPEARAMVETAGITVVIAPL